MRAQAPGDRFAAIARELLSQPSPTATLDRIFAVAVESIRGCDHAGISFIQHRRIETVAASDDVVAKGDEQQYQFDEGPCLDAIRDEETVRSNHLMDESRWPRWAPWVHDNLGVESMLCFQLFTSEHSYGGLNLYSDHVNGFDTHDQTMGLALAAHAAVAIASSQEIEGLTVALANRTVIGQAEGILMERYGLSAERAFAFLVRVSRQENRRLVRIAEDFVKTRHTPGESSASN
ncbi:GAF and ANTAR domain-containing protein [Microlunatus soli]|uniref:GAF domain-containing protein n=1 Tax=Microlunatus soli TaxID=630515 RepID=A0A1H1N9P2_9ACTN|nr:GAF and ANTAR domain-containing protein [Microlunatus soli]SDR95694.1 GAF domain-containing protein [Microlunatus soli]